MRWILSCALAAIAGCGSTTTDVRDAGPTPDGGGLALQDGGFDGGLTLLDAGTAARVILRIGPTGLVPQLSTARPGDVVEIRNEDQFDHVILSFSTGGTSFACPELDVGVVAAGASTEIVLGPGVRTCAVRDAQRPGDLAYMAGIAVQ